jgi:hypothetical protein
VSKERQKRRAEREAAAAVVAARRAAEAEKHARRDARRERLTGWVPKPARPAGLLAEKRGRQARATVAVLVALNLLVFAFSRDWYLTGLTLVASLLGAPIVHMMLFRKG